MAAPSVTWYPVTDSTGSPSKGSLITVLDFGNVQAGYWSDCKCVVATFSGNTCNTLKYWLNDMASTGGNTNIAASAGWVHKYACDSTWTDPTTFTDANKAGTAEYRTGRSTATLPEAEPGSSNFTDNTTTVTDPDDTDYIFLAVQPPSDAGDGVTENWGYRLSFLYP